MLYMIGIGLANPEDITVKGLDRVKKADKIYLEDYTSSLQCDIEDLEAFYGKKIIKSDRVHVEQSGEIIKNAKKEKVAFLVMGDVFSATTHFDIYKEALEAGIEVELIHNSSVLTAVSQTGLQLYKFGRTASIPFHNENVETPYKILKDNKKIGLHTLFLLDLNPSEEEFLTVGEALKYLLRVSDEETFNENTQCIACARLGSETSKIKSGTAKELLEADMGLPPFCLVVPGKMHFLEEEALDMWN